MRGLNPGTGSHETMLGGCGEDIMLNLRSPHLKTPGAQAGPHPVRPRSRRTTAEPRLLVRRPVGSFRSASPGYDNASPFGTCHEIRLILVRPLDQDRLPWTFAHETQAPSMRSDRGKRTPASFRAAGPSPLRPPQR